jgi:hypothetical protein
LLNGDVTASLEMADSGQPPTEVDTLVNEIFEMLMDVEIKRIDHSSHKLYFDAILRGLPSFSPEVSAERLRKFMSMLQEGTSGAAPASIFRRAQSPQWQ